MSRARFLVAATLSAVFFSLSGAGCSALVSDGDYVVADAAVDTGSPVVPDSAPPPTPEAGPTCTPSSGASPCSQCQDTACCADIAACNGNPECAALLNCEVSCTDSSCVSSCQSQHAAGVSALAAWSSCVSTNCPVCSQAGVGDPCTKTSDCGPNLTCTGLWCTKSCAGDHDCAGAYDNGLNRFGTANTCAINGLKAAICFPGCTTNADCAGYAATTCVSDLNPSGGASMICATHTVHDAGTD